MFNILKNADSNSLMHNRYRNVAGEYCYNYGAGIEDIKKDLGIYFKKDCIMVNHNGYKKRMIINPTYVLFPDKVSSDLSRLQYSISYNGNNIGFGEISLNPKTPDHNPFNLSWNYNKSKVKFYLSLQNSKNDLIINYYLAQKFKDRYKIIDNEFNDDININMQITLDANELDEIIFLLYLSTNNFSNSIYGIDAFTILNVVENTLYFQDCINRNYGGFSNEIISLSHNIFNQVKNKHKFSDLQATQYIFDTYCQKPFDDPKNLIDNINISYDVLKKKKEKIYNEMVLKGIVTPKWKSEATLFKLVKKIYPDAIFQYRDGKILDYQSLDIYIPSIRTGIEYQGIQHYKPIEFFGGIEGFNKRIHLDKLKKEKCMKNFITLIEWKYDEPISKVWIEKKLSLSSKIVK